MTGASTVATIVFLAVVVLVAALVLAAVVKLSSREAATAHPRSRLAAAAMFVLWLVLPGVVTALGLVDRYAPLPPVALLPTLLATLTTFAVALSPVGGRVAAAVPIAALVGFQVFRVPVEWWLHRMYTEGLVPVQMTFAGRNFDIVTGLTAGLLGAWLWAGRRSRTLVLAWNLLGLGLLVNIVAVAVLSTPAPFRVFTNEPANVLPSTFPWVWLPTVLVQAALLGHLLVFRHLRGLRGFTL